MSSIDGLVMMACVSSVIRQSSNGAFEPFMRNLSSTIKESREFGTNEFNEMADLVFENKNKYDALSCELVEAARNAQLNGFKDTNSLKELIDETKAFLSVFISNLSSLSDCFPEILARAGKALSEDVIVTLEEVESALREMEKSL